MNSFAKVHVLHCGEILADRALPHKEKSLHPFPQYGILRPEKYKSWIPISCYLIEHPNGLVLVDTGMDESIRNPADTFLQKTINKFFPARLAPGSSIREQLKKRNISPKDIDTVFLTHRDYDHIHGIPLLTDAPRFLINEKEVEAARKFEQKMLNGVNLETFKGEPIPFGPYFSGKDLYGDGIIYLVETPGHTVGHTSLLVRVKDGWLLLAADAGYSSRSWKELVIPGVTVNEEQALEALKWIQDFTKKDDCVAAIANHDPAVKETSY